jgi:hypothetical protein
MLAPADNARLAKRIIQPQCTVSESSRRIVLQRFMSAKNKHGSRDKISGADFRVTFDMARVESPRAQVMRCLV